MIGLAPALPEISAAAKELEAKGFRLLAGATGTGAAMRIAGLIALSDPPRADSAALVTEMRTLGVRTVMVTGDAPATAAIVARAVGLDGAVCPPGPIGDAVKPEQFAVFAGVPPGGQVQAREGVSERRPQCCDVRRRRQRRARIAAGTDGNRGIDRDRRRQVGGGIVLTKPGLGGIVASVKEGRMTFQRILTYTLSSVNKKIVQVLFLAVGLVMTGHAIVTPMLMVIIMLTGDFLGMSLTTDNVSPSRLSNAWRIGNLTIVGIFMGVCELAFCTAVLVIGKFRLGLGIEALQTMAFLAIVFGTEASLYAIRARQHLWSMPSRWLVLSSVADVVIGSTMAIFGIAMTALPVILVAGTLAAAVAVAFVADVAKISVFNRLRIA